MKIAFPTSKNIIKTVITAFILAIITYFVVPVLDLGELGAARLATYSILIGAVITGIVVSTSLELNLFTGDQVSIFIGNLAFKANANDLRELFSSYGNVQNVRVMTDRATRRPKGFAFVEMDKKGAKAAIAELDGSEFFGRDIKVNYATRRKRAA